LEILPKNVQLLGNRSFAYLRLYQRDKKVAMIMQAMEDAKLATETEGEWAKGWVRAGEVFVAQSEDVRVYKDEEGLKRVLLAAESAWMAAVGYGEGKVRRGTNNIVNIADCAILTIIFQSRKRNWKLCGRE
jgi:hypothetical protein